MLYDKSHSPTLSEDLFCHPTSEFRAAPFWAWNCKLDKDVIARQIGYMKEMGLGGFHMHVRTGLDTPYLSDEYMDDIRFCVETARKNGMLAWAYDEDRWPSGAAGGLVTKDPAFRARYLLFTPTPYARDGAGEETLVDASAKMKRAENGTLLACYDVELGEDGSLSRYAVIGASEQARGRKWYAYCEVAPSSPWYNNQTYVNTLDKRAIERFVEVTHERYRETVGEAFGNTIPAFFTDEPQFSHKQVLPYAFSETDVVIPWTNDLSDTFRAAYGADLLAHLPELFWELPDGRVSCIRYRYHDHVAERFSVAFADTVGTWCRKNGIKLTGHMMEEPTLSSQTAAIGEAMRAYRSFDLPGIDMLCDNIELTTAKQAQSAVHQFGYEGMTSELYGVTGWAFDFRGHKWQGDWQAALGVTVRVPHLAWMSMKGEAKRDYPASIFYQSPWYKEYGYVEDHFARVNTALTRGRPVVRVGVIHPIESYWLHWGPNEETGLVRDQLDSQFGNTIQWLLFGGIDFDYICESLLPQQCAEGGAPLKVGEMAYDAVVISGCETLRRSTVERLTAFVEAGGRLIVMGEAPHLVEAEPDEAGRLLAEKAQQIPISRAALLTALDPVRTVRMNGSSGKLTENLIYQLRQDGANRWLFAAHAKKPNNPDLPHCDTVRFTLDGCWKPTQYNTLDGTVRPLSYEAGADSTTFTSALYEYDSLLVLLEPAAPGSARTVGHRKPTAKAELTLPDRVPVTLSEPNVLLLDRAEYALDGGEWQPRTEMLRLCNNCRRELGFSPVDGRTAQPWTQEKEQLTHRVTVRFTVISDRPLAGVKLALEDAERAEVTLGGEVAGAPDGGWYVDEAIRTVPLPPLKAGANTLEITWPFGQTVSLEWCYLLGDFGVTVAGAETSLTAPVRELAFGDVTSQGLPFYGGNLTYHIPFTLETAGEISVETTRYRGGLLRLSVDGENSRPVAYPPYEYQPEQTLSAGPHTLQLTLYGNRQNAFGAVHMCNETLGWYGPGAWRTTGAQWSEEYCLARLGVLKAPVLCRRDG